MDMSTKNLDYVNVVNVVARPMLLYIQVYDDESYSFLLNGGASKTHIKLFLYL